MAIIIDEGTHPIVPSTKKLYINKLINDIKYRQLPFTGDVYTLIDKNDKHKAYKSIQAILLKALKHFEYSFPLSIETNINIVNNQYTFMDNFSGYINGTITDDEVELVPEVVFTLGGGPGCYSMTANYFKYSKPVLIATTGIVKVHYYTHYPCYIKYADDGGFTDDSFIWGIKDVRFFEDQFDLDLIRSIKKYSEQVRFAGISVEFINLDQTIQQLMEDVEANNAASSVILDAWE